MKRQKRVIRRKYNPDWKRTAPTILYISKDGSLTENESEAKNKIRRDRKFRLDSNGHYIEIAR